MTDAASDLGGEVVLGSMLFTLVEPHRGHEVAYNRWYERDHFYAGCMVGPWLFAGRRWVSPRRLKDLRFGADVDLFGGADLGSYVAIYWILEGRHDDHVDWALRQVHWLHANGRMFAERDHVHTLMYRLGERPADDAGVPIELALDHPFAGLIATLVRPIDGTSGATIGAALEGPGSTGAGFTPIPLPPDAPVAQQGHDQLDGCLLHLRFTTSDPGDTWDDHRAACRELEEGALARVLWTSPFIPTLPGTDTYTDELW